jgi:D-erythritol 1-phosphate dehydrogenase
VREALIEREVLLATAPHIIWPMRFVLPHSPEQRPAWMIRVGLFLYDHLGSRERLAPSRSLDRGATVLTRTACVALDREGDLWRAALEDARTGARRSVRARCVLNAAGPWVEQVLDSVARGHRARRVRLVKGSHIVLRKFWDGPQAYLLQNTDRRVIFVNPYEGGLCLIGTTDIAHEGRPDDLVVDGGEVDYLLGVVNRYFAIELLRRPAAV